MAVVIRLQGLPVVAGSADIRNFFSGLNIPDGGVHITGGEKGGAFIIFVTDEDARQAMSYSGRYIMGSRIELFLSSKTEMHNIIEINRKKLHHSGRETVIGSRHIGSNKSESSGVGSLSNLVAAIKKGMDKSSYDSVEVLKGKFHSSASRNSSSEISKTYYPRTGSDALYLFLRGMPYSATEEDVIHFFSRIQVEGVIIIKINGQNIGNGIVKFATASDALEGLKRNRTYMGSRFIEVNQSNERTWIKYGGRVDKYMGNPFSTEESASSFNAESFCSDTANLSSERHAHSRSSSRRIMAHTHSKSPSPPRRIIAHTHSKSPSPPRMIMTHTYSRSPSRKITAWSNSQSPPRMITMRTHSRSPPRRVAARTSSRSPLRISRSPLRKVTARSHSPFSGSGCGLSVSRYTSYIHVKNLPVAIEKSDLRSFFGESDIPDSDIIFLQLDSKRSKDAVVALTSKKAYESALNCHKQSFHYQTVFISPLSKTLALELARTSETTKSPERHHRREKYDQNENSSSHTCVYVRNFPYDVTKVEVQKFFAGFNIDDQDIYLLYDDKGVGLGEVLVKFRSEVQARKAESLNRQRFLGTEVLLRCISEEQMRELGSNIPSVANKMPHHLHTHERSELVYPVDFQGPFVQEDFPSDCRISSDNLKQLSDYRCLSDDLIHLPDHFKGPPTVTNFGEGIHGNFPGGPFVSDSNFRGGSANITVVKLSNLPFQVSHNEILDFFHGYKIIPESLFLQQNEYAMFSGEALIALVNYDEAVTAVNELNDRPIGQRKIRLNLYK